MNNIPMPEKSSDFTIEDIHKIREWNYERRKGMTPAEINEDTHRGAERFYAELAKPADPEIEAEVDCLLQSVRKPIPV
ncbi:MAG: hypothetical protein FWD30_00255 [Dehalococcoidia bacterium]|nr:hypothetical protein [Dehalococcoidia bacterium]MCL2615225.1 hypothetical protein [Dehalococcoidia bacterium]